MARSNDLTLQVGFDIDRFNKELAKTNSSLTKWAGGITSSLKGVAAGFGAIAIGRFVLDVSRLAGEAEGVSAAFVKLENSAKLMTDLKKATGGTVSELELMKRSVMASNFDISLKALPQLLEFATLRARQTGQSVDYLVDSIVTGIGRKSKLILDNLGISAVQLTEALGGASAASSTIGEVAEAVGRIASKNLEQMGRLTDDAAVRAARLGAEWENLKVVFGQVVNESGFSNFLKTLAEDAKTFSQLSQLVKEGRLADSMAELNRQMAIYNLNSGEKVTKESIRAFHELQKIAKEAGVQLIALSETGKEIRQVFIKPNTVNFIDGTKTEEQVRNVKFLEETIAGLNEEIKLSGSQSQIAKYQREIEGLQAEIDKLLGKTKELFSPDALFVAGKMGGLTSKSPMEGVKNKTSVDLPVIAQGDIDSMKKGLEAVGEGWKKMSDKQKEASDSYIQNQERIAYSSAMLGDSIGNAIGGLISGTEDFAQTMGQAARQIVSSLERIALAYMIANSAKFGPVGIALAAAGFGVIKALFAQIGGDGASGGDGRIRRDRFQPQVVSQMGGNVTFKLRGQELHGVLENYGRTNNRTGT